MQLQFGNVLPGIDYKELVIKQKNQIYTIDVNYDAYIPVKNEKGEEMTKIETYQTKITMEYRQESEIFPYTILSIEKQKQS